MELVVIADNDKEKLKIFSQQNKTVYVYKKFGDKIEASLRNWFKDNY